MLACRFLRPAAALLAAALAGVLAAACGDGEEPGHDDGIAETSDAVRSREVVRGYKLPFAEGATHSIVQYPHGYRDQIWNAVDIGIPRGGDVLAMKAGRISAVIETNQDYAPGYVCNWAACNDATNFVIIQHDDGQESSYLHIARKSVSSLGIAPGTRVCQGQIIGKVGHNGYSFGPHVHVSVQAGGSAGARAQAWAAMWSKPTKVIEFIEARGEIVEGRAYRSQNGRTCGGSTTPPMDAGANASTKDASAKDASAKDAGAADAASDVEPDAGGPDWTNGSDTVEPEELAGDAPPPQGAAVRPGAGGQPSSGCSASPAPAGGGALVFSALAVAVLRVRRRRAAQ